MNPSYVSHVSHVLLLSYLDVSKNSGFSPKMDGENHGKPYEHG